MSHMDQTLVTRIVEAALLAANQPLTAVQLQALFPLDEPAPEGSVEAALVDLQAACEARGVELVELASGWRFQVRADVHPWVATATCPAGRSCWPPPRPSSTTSA